MGTKESSKDPENETAELSQEATNESTAVKSLKEARPGKGKKLRSAPKTQAKPN
jgi:hypothetical protein